MDNTLAILITIIAGALGTILSNYIWKYLRNERISAKRINSQNDKHLAGLIELYTTLFQDDGTNYSGEEILEFIDVKKYNKNRHIVAENIVLISLYQSQVVGFVFCHFYLEKKMAIISYLGIDKEVREARQFATKQLMALLKSILTNKAHNCEFVFFDILKPGKEIDLQENNQRKARNTLFKISARSMGLQAYEFDFDYQSPLINVSENAHEINLILLCIPFNKSFSNQITKNELLLFIEFIHLDCYGDIYTLDNPKYIEHQNHLIQKCEMYKTTLPELIPIIL